MPVILSPNLIVAAMSAAPAGTPWILWDNQAGPADMYAWFTPDLNYPASNLANPATNLEWRGRDPIGDNAFEFLNIAGPQNAIGIARHNFGTAGITVQVGYMDINNVFTLLIPGYTPANDEPLLFVFEPIESTKFIVYLFPGTAAPRCAVSYIGTVLVMERSLDINPDFAVPRFARRTEFQVGRSERGDYLGRIVTSQWLDGVEHVYKHITPQWYRDNCDPFVRAAQHDVPFFYTVMPLEHPYEVGYLWFQDDPIAVTSPVTRRMHVTFRMGGIME